MNKNIIELEELREKVKELKLNGRGRNKSRKGDNRNRNRSPASLSAKRRRNRDKSVETRSPPRSKSLLRSSRGKTTNSTLSNARSVCLDTKLL